MNPASHCAQPIGAAGVSSIAASPSAAPLRPFGWLVLTALALWPHWLWAARRLADGSDDPLGIAALAVLACATWQLAPRLRASPTPAWAAAAALATLAATLAHWLAAPALFALMFAALAMAAALCAFLPPHVPRLPLIGLALLGMPLIASMQFYAGFPLRVATAELSAWLLQAFGHSVQRSGTALWVGAKLVIVDAPCSGVQMVWLAYFCAFTLAWWRQLPDRLVVRRLAGVGAIVLAGNVIRNSVLVALEAGSTPPGPALHEAVGLMAQAGVCAAVLRLVHGSRDATR
jgi:exosortase/archaeosortase family protein